MRVLDAFSPKVTTPLGEHGSLGELGVAPVM